ncbi:MAG: FadR/GntR family transcriptional regulator [Aggregatilineales bacterium]
MTNKLNASTLVDQAIDELTTYIQSDNLQPGDSLPSMQYFTDQFQVSRSVVREAFRKLEARGIIEITNGKKATIRPITSEPLFEFFQHALQLQKDTVNEFMEIRRGLEIQSARLAAIRHSTEEMNQIRNILQQMIDNVLDVNRFSELDVELHLAIAKATHNKMLFHVIQSLRDAVKQTSVQGRVSRSTDEEIERVVVLHQALVSAIASRDPELAGRSMDDHFDNIAMTIDLIDPEDESR